MPDLTRKPVETEEQRRRRLLSPFRSAPLATSSDVLATEPLTRTPMPAPSIAPALESAPAPSNPYAMPPTRESMGGPPTMNAVDPIAQGIATLSRLEDQRRHENGGVKQLLIRAGLGFVGGGIPGAITSGLDEYSTHRLARRPFDEQIARTQDQLQRQIGLGQAQSQAQMQQAQIEALKRKPDEEAEQNRERDYQDTVKTLQQLRATTAPKELEQLRRQEELRLGRVIPLPAYEKQDQPQMLGEFNLPPGGRRFKRNADGTLSVIAEVPPLPQPSNVDAVGKQGAARNAAQTRLQQAQSAASAYQEQLKALDQSAAQLLTYAPLTQPDDKGVPRVVTDNKNVVYGDKKTPERLQYEQQRKELQQKLDGALKEVNDANVALNSIYLPVPRGGSGGSGSPLTRRQEPKPAMGLSRATFRTNNAAATKGLSDQEVDAMIRGGGFTPLP